MLFGVIMGLAASASWAAVNVFVASSSRAVGPFRALVWAQVVGGLALAPFALAFDQRLAPIDGRIIAWVAVAAVASVLGYGCMFFSMERGRLSVVVPIMSSWAVISAALSIGVLGESLRRSHLFGAALVVVGVLMVSRFSQPAKGEAGESGPPATGDGKVAGPGGATGADDVERRSLRRTLLASAGAAVGFGVLVPAIDQIAPVAGRLGAIPLVFIIELALGVPLALLAGIDLSFPPRRTWPVIAAAGLLETAGFAWISLGTARAPVAVVSPLAGLASAFTVLYAWLILRERPRGTVLAGAAIACAGVVTLAVR